MPNPDHAIIAFDGLSLAGKSTMVSMLRERSQNALVIRENVYDPLRPVTSRLNRIFKENVCSYNKGLDQLAQEYQEGSYVLETIDEARRYADRLELEGPDREKRRQACLAYFFAKGRAFVNDEVRKQIMMSDVILDRWQASGWAYQTCPAKTEEDDPYTWHNVRELNEEMGIWYPNMQIIVTCPIEQIPQRRAFRQKIGAGTAGQMSDGREEMICNNFQEIYKWLLGRGVPTIWVENHGAPCESLEDQLRQAIPNYLALEDELCDNIENRIIGGFDAYNLAPGSLSEKEAEQFFLQPEVLDRIYRRQV
ncbi:MAG: hypothetical protein QMD85_05515 [Candidatus Aenigmarchaeota archaeon]|nr:hypothetical protein [Candidatus Aenigmarchaeota archaeon]